MKRTDTPMSRRSFIKTSAVGAASLTLASLGLNPSKNSAFADEQPTEQVPLTSELATSIAIDVAESYSANVAFQSLNDPILYFNLQGKPQGYIVGLSDGNQAYGYVILNVNAPMLVSDFCIDAGVMHPLFQTQALSSIQSASDYVCKISPFDYYRINYDAGEIYGYDGSSINPESIAPYSSPIGSQDPFVEISQIINNYNIVSQTNLPFFVGEDESIIGAQQYACTAMSGMAIASYLNVLPGRPFDFASQYTIMSNMIGVDSTGGAGVLQMRSGVVEYCKKFGRAQTHCPYPTFNPSYSFFTDSINSGRIASYGYFYINENHPDTTSGHVVTVEGYATIEPKIIDKSLRGRFESDMLIVYDGWTSSARYMWYDMDDFVGTSNGLTFY